MGSFADLAHVKHANLPQKIRDATSKPWKKSRLTTRFSLPLSSVFTLRSRASRAKITPN
jgi:hypothetical protein